VTPENAETQS